MADRLLLGGRWHTFTKTLTFFAAEPDEVVETLVGLRNARTLEVHGAPLAVVPTSGTLEEQLQQFLPVDSHTRRMFFTSVETEGPYKTVMMKNRRVPIDSTSECMALCVRGVGSVVVDASPHDPKGTIWPFGFTGDCALTVRTPVPATGGDHPYQIKGRNVGVVYRDGWEFEDLGDPLPFEDLRRYKAVRKRSRFDFDLLTSYLNELGLDFDARKYAPERRGSIITQTHRPSSVTRQFTLEEALSGDFSDELGRPHPDAKDPSEEEGPLVLVTYVTPDGQRHTTESRPGVTPR